MPSITDQIIDLMPVSHTHIQTPYMAIFAFLLAQSIGVRWPMVFLGCDYNQHPRRNFEITEKRIQAGKTKLTMSQLDTLKRMYAAHNNGLENLSLYYVAIVVALIAKLPAKEANGLAAFYLLTRFVYNVCYALISTWGLSPVRTAVYWFGMLSCFSLLWRSGDLLAAKRW